MILATQDAQVPCRLIQPRKAAQATTAGAVSERNPATTPISKAISRTSTCVTETLLENDQPGNGIEVRAHGGNTASALQQP